MRHRQTVTGGFTTPHVRESRSRSCGGAWGSYTPIGTTYTGTRFTKTVDDVETPGFHHLQKCGSFLPINPFVISTFVEERSTVDDYDYHTRPPSCPDFVQEIRGACYFDYSRTVFPPSITEAMIGSVVNGAVAKVRGGILDVLTSIAESGDVLRTFRTTLDGIGSLALKAAKKSKSPGDFHSHWLNYRYGWLPLIFTLNDAIKAYNNTFTGLLGEKAFVTIPVNINNSRVESYDGYAYSIVETLTGRIRVGGMAYGHVDALSHSIGFNPIVTAWELVPFSFVIDWFFQVGTWLEATTSSNALFGGSMVYSGASVKQELVYTHSRRIVFSNTAVGTIQTGGGSVGKLVERLTSYERYPQSTSLPGWNPRITPSRILDAIALVLTQKSRVLRALF